MNTSATLLVSERRAHRNLGYMKTGLARLQVRMNALERVLQKLQQRLVAGESTESISCLETAIEQHHAFLHDMENYILHCEQEVIKVELGIHQALQLEDGTAKAAFLAYLVTDTELSIANIEQTRQDYTEIFSRLRTLAQLWD